MPLRGGGWLSCGLNFELGADELQLDVLLDGRRLADWTRVIIPDSEIWGILHQCTKGSPVLLPLGHANATGKLGQSQRGQFIQGRLEFQRVRLGHAVVKDRHLPVGTENDGR